MTMRITRKQATVFIILAVASVALFFITEHVINNDPSGPLIAEYVRQHQAVMERVGNVQNADLVRRVAVGPNDSGGYRVYTFVVSGTNATATVVVRADRLAGAETTEHYTIVSIDQ
jgi:hypothetical protein